MMRFRVWSVTVVVCVMALVTGVAGAAPVGEPAGDEASSLSVIQLRVEYGENPLGIDVERPRLGWLLESARRGGVQTAYQVLVGSTAELLADGVGDVWDSGRVESGESVQVVYGGPALESRQRYHWRVRVWDGDGAVSAWSEPAWWEMGLLDPDDWEAAWIGADRDGPLGPVDQRSLRDVPFIGPGACNNIPGIADTRLCRTPEPQQQGIYQRTEFTVDQPVARARVYATALGVYELHVNGQRVGEDYFAPGWTDYDRRVQYQTYDVTELVADGQNAVGAILGDGWYAGYLAHLPPKQYGDQPHALVQLEVEYIDGSRDHVVSDGSWRAAIGPILSSDMLMGETYDARLEMPGWSTPGFDDSEWETVEVAEGVTTELVAQIDLPVRQTGELVAVSVTEPEPGAYVFDLGQNMVGWSRLRVNGEEGDAVQLRHAEVLNPDGTIYTENLRAAKATNTYVLKGGGEEVFEPHFTFHGFRYVEVTGYPGEPPLDAVTGVVVNSDLAWTGDFDTSDPMLNQLQSNITWSQRGNFLSIPTDCPQRDERMGWTGDAQIFARTATFNMDVAGFFTKWMVDVEDAQRSNGAFTDVAPDICCGAGTAGWGDAGVIVPWTMYQAYGDTRVIERHYDAMVRWIDYLKANSDGWLRPAQGYGDWLNTDDDTPRDVIATAYFAESARLLAKMADVIGRADDAAAYRNVFESVKAAFIDAYVADDGRVEGDTQTAYVLALHMDLLPTALRAPAAARLVELIESRDWHLSTGFLGTRDLLAVLTDAGYLDVAYRLLTNDTFPSWGYPIVNGDATTIWERWDAVREDGTYQDPAMTSFNHYAYGAVGEWMYRYMAGLDVDPEGPGFKRIVIRPRPGGDLTEARAAYESVHGTVASGWTLENQVLHLDVTIPTNTTATVHVPAVDETSVAEGGVRAAQAEGVTFTGMADGAAVFTVGGGTYAFTSGL